MLVEKRVRSVLPYYVIGVVWVLMGWFLPLVSWGNVAIVGVVSVVCFLVSHRIIPDRVVMVEQGHVPTGDEVLDQVSMALGKLGTVVRRHEVALQGSVINKDVTQIYATAEKLGRFIQDNPSKARNLRSFTDYHVPTTGSLIESYVQLLSKGQGTPNIAQSKANIEEAMAALVIGYEKQLDALFADKSLDISAEVRLLKTLLEREGLT